jgi:hypothetical protein
MRDDYYMWSKRRGQMKNSQLLEQRIHANHLLKGKYRNACISNAYSSHLLFDK